MSRRRCLGLPLAALVDGLLPAAARAQPLPAADAASGPTAGPAPRQTTGSAPEPDPQPAPEPTTDRAPGEAADAARYGPDTRLALLLGNTDYPHDDDLPSIGTNVRLLAQALGQRGFEVKAHVDQDLPGSRQALQDFVRRVQAAPADAVVLFYFSGHGAQVESENLLLPAGVDPRARSDQLLRASLQLGRDVIAPLSQTGRGLLVAVVDACRTGPPPSGRGEGLNQVEAPPGCLIAFSTGAGKPALAPVRAEDTTFYTGALVQQLGGAADVLSFSDVFRLAKLSTQEAMLSHPVPVVRRFAQFPFIAENTARPVPLARRGRPQPTRRAAAARPGPAPGAAAPGAAAAPAARRTLLPDEATHWALLQAARWPRDVLHWADAFLADYPDSARLGAVRVARAGAAEAAQVLARGEVRLWRSSFHPAAGDAALVADLLKAGRGDKDAAARVGRRQRSDAVDGPELARYEGWMQFAAELGNGIAAYELALSYRRLQQPLAAGRWQARATALGYTPPPSLDNRRT